MTENKKTIEETPERREMLAKLGKYAVYAAPFTVMAFAKKAEAATGHAFGKHSGQR